MVHPVQSVIESLHAAGRCPRLYVNAVHVDVVCPDFIRDQWRERLVIDLDKTYPLALEFDDTSGVHANLSFGEQITRCQFPWEAIYVVVDRETGRGIVLDRNMPESIRRLRDSEGERRPELRSVEPGQPKPEAAAPSSTPEPVPVSEATPAIAAATPAPATDPAKERQETEAKQRRAAFRVIDGGGDG